MGLAYAAWNGRGGGTDCGVPVATPRKESLRRLRAADVLTCSSRIVPQTVQNDRGTTLSHPAEGSHSFQPYFPVINPEQDFQEIQDTRVRNRGEFPDQGQPRFLRVEQDILHETDEPIFPLVEKFRKRRPESGAVPAEEQGEGGAAHIDAVLLQRAEERLFPIILQVSSLEGYLDELVDPDLIVEKIEEIGVLGDQVAAFFPPQLPHEGGKGALPRLSGACRRSLPSRQG